MHKESSRTWVVPMLMIIAFPFNTVNCQNTQNVQGNWTGRISFHEKANTITGWSEKTINVSIRDNKGTGTITYQDELIIEGKSFGKSDCQGDGDVDLVTVLLNPYDNTYEISTVGPTCASGSNPWSPYHGNGITILDHKFTNSGVLAGSESKTVQIEGNLGTVTTTITWNLTRTPENDVELIVIPEEYDTWLPEPGRTERAAGSILKVSLKLRGTNGTSTNKKAKSFELKLINTSSEPGMTINYPVNSNNTSFDLRFMPQNDGVPGDTAFQNFIIPCIPSRQTAGFKIGSYDGGGWTVLNAEAVLDDEMETRVRGRLLVSNGEMDIRIPKREPNSKIAESWLKQNRNPAEMDDIESSKGNPNKGDGITAYEEYRGVIAESKFKRLDPAKKEVGIDVIKSELSFFSEGIKWFENASGLAAIIFHEDLNEIGLDRRLNKNAKTNHDYDQYVLRLYKSVIPGGNTLGKAYGGPGIPAKTFAVVLDYNAIQGEYAYLQTYARTTLNTTLSFTLLELLSKTIAHELGHGVNCWHHGRTNAGTPGTVSKEDPFRIFRYPAIEITDRPYTLAAIIGGKGNQESGDLSCFMAYAPWCKWAASEKGGISYFYQAPIMNLGKDLCISIDGTGINKKDAAGNNNYFGDASKGKCLAQIQLRN